MSSFIGIDLGSSVSRIAQLDPEKKMPVIVRNNLCLENTKTCVSCIAGEARQFGDNASSKSLSRPNSVVSDLLHWLLKDSHEPRQIGDEEFTCSQIVSFYLKSLLSFAHPFKKLSIAVPHCDAEILTTICEAMELMAIPRENLSIVDCGEASLTYLHHLQRSSFSEVPTCVCVVNVGHNFTTVAIGSITIDSVKKIHSSCLESGSSTIDVALGDFVFDILEKKHPSAGLKHHVKSREKVLRECRKAKEMLSSVDNARVQAESLKDDIDANVPISRQDLERLAKPFADELCLFLQAAANKCNDMCEISKMRIEAIGGGWRTPLLQDAIKMAFQCARIGVSLDCNLAVAEGAAILALCRDSTINDRDPIHNVVLEEFQSPFVPPVPQSPSERIASLLSKEQELEARDAQITQRIHSINQLDAFIIQTLETAHHCLKDQERLALISNALRCEETYVQDNCNEEPSALIEERLRSVQRFVDSDFREIKAHHESLKEEQRRKDEELERLSKLQSEDRELKSDPQRLRGAQQRREQGQTLFKQEHWAEAQTRFVQALAILGELYDTKDVENKKKKDEISLSCYLNIASCSIKLSMWRNAFNNATSALELSPNHPKALFRRGQASSMQGDFSSAIKDLEAAKLLSNDDPAVLAELDSAIKKEAAEKAREKKMFAKMFA